MTEKTNDFLIIRGYDLESCEGFGPGVGYRGIELPNGKQYIIEEEDYLTAPRVNGIHRLIRAYQLVHYDNLTGVATAKILTNPRLLGLISTEIDFEEKQIVRMLEDLEESPNRECELLFS